MYLEISGRATGKTKRLCEAVVSHLRQYGSSAMAVIISPSGHRAKYDALIDEKYHDMVLVTHDYEIAKERLVNHETQESITFEDFSFKLGMGFGNIKYFFDDFDYGKSEIPTLDDGYYVTTPFKIRNLDDWLFWREDKLLTLLIENNFMYTSVHGMMGMIDGNLNLAATCRVMPHGEVGREFLSGFDQAVFEQPYFDRDIYPADVFKGIFDSIKRDDSEKR